MGIEELKKQLLQGDVYKILREEISFFGVKGFMETYDFLSLYTFLKNNCSDGQYKLFVCLCEKNFNLFVKCIESKKEILILFLKENALYYSLFYKTNLESFKIFMNVLKNSKELVNCNLSFLTVIPCDVVSLYAKDITDDKELAMFVNYNHAFCESFFRDDSRALSLLESGLVSVSLILRGDLKVSEDILQSEVFFDGLKDTSMITFRNNLDKVMKQNPSYALLRQMENYERNLIESFDLETEQFALYKGLEEKEYISLYESKKDKFLYGDSPFIGDWKESKYSKKKFEDLIIDYLFNDNIYNVIKNIKEMFRYQKTVGKILLSDFSLELYQKIIHWQKLSSKEKLDVYLEYRDLQVHTTFYEDIRKCRETSYKEMIAKLYVPEVKNDTLTSLYGADVYVLDGQDFTMLVRGLQESYKTSFEVYRECFSLINHENMDVIDASYYYGYTNINFNAILHVSEVDSYSSDMQDSSNRVNRIMTSEEINSYAGYSEIQIVMKDEKSLKPDYLVAFDTLSEEEIQSASTLHIPIVLIDRKKYEKKKDLIGNNLFSSEKYVMNALDEREERKIQMNGGSFKM